jgi:hypothetical protein
VTEPFALLRDLMDHASKPQADRYLEQLAQSGATSDVMSALLDRFESTIRRFEAVHAPTGREIAREVLALTRAAGKGRGVESGPSTGWSKVDAHGERLTLDSAMWSAAVDLGHRLMWTVNAEQSGDEPNPCRQVRWRNALELLAELNYQVWCGYRDWRIPSIGELATLTGTAEGRADDRISATLFPDLRGDKVYWSSTRFEDTRLLQTLNFTDATRAARQVGTHSYLRFVRTMCDDES